MNIKSTIMMMFKNYITRYNYKEKKHDSLFFTYKGHKTYSNYSFANKGLSMKTNKHIVYVNEFNKYETMHGPQNQKDLFQLLMRNINNISEITNIPTVAYISNIYSEDENEIMIKNNDVFDITYIISSYKDYDEINLVILSNGGFVSAAIGIVEMLYNNFKKVNFIVPLHAGSMASMMCMAANKIILTPESSLGPYDSYYKSPTTGKFLPIETLVKTAKGAKKAFSIFYPFESKALYKGWSIEDINTILQQNKQTYKERKEVPFIWIIKYMYKINIPSNKLLFFLYKSYLKIFTKHGRRAKKITDYFISTGQEISHEMPIMYNTIKDIGLNVEKSERELLDILRENTYLSLRECSKFCVSLI